MPPKRKTGEQSSEDASSSAAKPPAQVKVKIEGGRSGTTNDTALTVDSSERGPSSSSSSSSSSSEAAAKKARNEGLAEGLAHRTKLAREMAENYTCPITQELMFDPVMAEDGNTYERKGIETWILTNNTSPLDPSTVISVQGLRLNRSAQKTILELVESNNLDEEVKEAWYARKKVVELEMARKLFDEGRVLEAAKLGLPKAMGEMAWRYFYGQDGETKDDDKAFDFATKAAKEGDGLGMFILGNCYCYGIGVADDQVAAVRWYEESAAKGHYYGMLFSGQLYSAGEGCVKDDAKAASYFQRASDLGNYHSTNELGNCYYDGAGVAKNLKKARILFKKVADLNYSHGDVNLGQMMIRGEGGDSEVGKGFRLIEKAAKLGNGNAVAHLAEVVELAKKWKKSGVYKIGTD